jgi:fructoselysine-6-P-deglycase FrlB-like protein
MTTAPPADRAALFRADIEASAAALERQLDAYAAPTGALATIGVLGASASSRPLVIGLGSSRYAGLAVRDVLRERGVGLDVERPADVESVAHEPGRLVFAVSASGQTPELVRAVARHAEAAEVVVGVTNDSSSVLAGTATATLPLLAGAEQAGVACRTFRATVSALALSIGRLGGGGYDVERIRPSVAGLTSVIDGSAVWLTDVASELDRADDVHVIGGPGRAGLIDQAALMLREAPRLWATAYDASEWLHVGVYTALPGSAALVYSGTAYDGEIVDTVKRRGGRVVVVGRPIDGASLVVPVPVSADPLVDAIVESAVAELIAAELWSRAGP